MKTSLRQIGSSKGIIIPASLIKHYSFEDEIELRADEHGIYLQPIRLTQVGWEDDAKKLAKSSEEVIMDDVFDDPEAEWVW